MSPNLKFDIVVYGATGYTGRLVCEYLNKRYGVNGDVNWAMAGRSHKKLEQVRDDIGVPLEVPFVIADADDLASVNDMVTSTKVVITTVGPYQLYGSDLVAACVAAGSGQRRRFMQTCQWRCTPPKAYRAASRPPRA